MKVSRGNFVAPPVRGACKSEDCGTENAEVKVLWSGVCLSGRSSAKDGGVQSSLLKLLLSLLLEGWVLADCELRLAAVAIDV